MNKNGQASTGLMKFTLQPGRVGEVAMGGMPMSMLSGK